jgi:hypothetical protein
MVPLHWFIVESEFLDPRVSALLKSWHLNSFPSQEHSKFRIAQMNSKYIDKD